MRLKMYVVIQKNKKLDVYKNLKLCMYNIFKKVNFFETMSILT